MWMDRTMMEGVPATPPHDHSEPTSDALAKASDQSETLAGVVAIVGCDGSGKTRLVTDLVAILQKSRRAERRYMGLISGETGDKIKRLPFLGPALERYLASKVRRAQDMEKKLPGVLTAIVMYLFSLWRVLQMRRLKRRAQTGILVIAERYPQAEIPGFHFDGPGLAVDRSENRLVRKLANREQRIYNRMARNKPTLILRLMVDADTAFARKPDHPLAELRDKIDKMPLIEYDGARIVEVDARLPYNAVLKKAFAVINEAIEPSRKGGPLVTPDRHAGRGSWSGALR